MKFTAIFKTGISKKNGKEYQFLEIELNTGYRKKAFLSEAESALIAATNESEFVAQLGEGIGRESGKPYTCIDIQLNADCIKKVFLDNAELALIKLGT